ncbi:hypothetical protein [Jannaschia seohaensis]|uniref:Uncharacterized protein n=1 Tax=Jannaschia seohaensis TaxID=475081 RepID=A0A2Y9B692_9RHOB|nr:hypothetical protein [Jannaschia seohaensis]PWJ09849.1 hypothetical protein BCF38_12810 [Jannaschia seohaensis]SSA51930.1 hypothetical protein SAMN05421539_12810 [Jannaschia seohaensis]
MNLPPYYFRIKENGAAVFRVDAETRQRRLEMEQIASVNVANGTVRAQGGRDLTDADRAAIDAWLAERRATLAKREAETVQRTIEALNLTAQWAQARGSDDEVEAATDALLLAMHDLRSVLVRKRADRLAGRSDTE